MSDKKLPKHMRKSRQEKDTDKLVDSMYEQYGPKGSRTAFGITRSEFKRAEDPDDKKGIEKDIYKTVIKKKDYTLNHFKRNILSL